MQVFPSPTAFAVALAEQVVARAAGAIAARGRFTLALAGGPAPLAAYRLLGSHAFQHRIEWARLHVCWSEECCVAPGDPRSHYRMAREAFLDRVPVPDDQIHRIQGEADPAEAAVRYERVLRALTRADGQDPASPGPLDLVLIATGDGRPSPTPRPEGSDAGHGTPWVVVTPPEGSGMRRIVLTPTVLATARNITFIVSDSTTDAGWPPQALAGPLRPAASDSQIAGLSEGRHVWVIDPATAGGLP